MSDPRGYIDFAAVKAAVTLEKILRHYGILETLQPQGGSLRSCCPIHKGTDASEFSVTLERNLWNCFSACKKGGTMLEFVIQMEQCSPQEAAWKVNDWFTLGHGKKTAPRNRPAAKQRQPGSKAAPEPAGSSPEPEALQPAPSSAAGPQTPAVKEPAGEETGENAVLGFSLANLDDAHPYLRERGLTPETIAHFGIGHCPKGIMAGRIAIPVHNAAGEIVANAGRWPGEPPEGKEKYRLPGQFKKTLEVFNLHRAAGESPNLPLVIVEGFFAVMHLWQHGVRRVVALMGSHLSARQEERIAALVTPESRIILMMDNDGAGNEAARKMVPRLAGHCFVKTFRWPEGITQPDGLHSGHLGELLMDD